MPALARPVVVVASSGATITHGRVLEDTEVYERALPNQVDI
jgi:hypothetical protein